ncbi:MAG TPA: ATP-dependent helicase HrpB [Acidimicrobiia bacterium]|nr:ATP-dependent helicase HrpB [Acidimicrobiia bacterium]
MQPTGLPVEAVLADVAEALVRNGSAVLVAPPGSGKTTVVPLHLLDFIDGKILVLEPRRLATRAAARRMAALLDEPVGTTVGYVTRHDRATGPATRVEVVTEGVLTRRLQSDPSLAGTSLVIFDELHERNLQTDLGLALALDTKSGLRPDLGILAMSATIDTDAVAVLLGTDGAPAPVITADARQHPVDIRWTPPPPRQRGTEGHVANVVRRALADDQGDILVFLPGMGEIRRVADLLTDVLADVRLLHGSLPVEEQDLAISPSTPPIRKVVLSTDIAESSLTVEGTGVVIDSGLARAPRFDARTGMTRLQTVPISRASADQRAGRAGRLGPGVAYRLWSKMEHAARRPHIDAEITQVDLTGLALELAAWGVTDPRRLRWLDPPSPSAWAEAVGLLERLGSLDDGRLTDSGRRMAQLPLHPRLSRMIVDAGKDAGLAVWLATIIDERDPIRGRPDEVPTDLALRVRLLIDRSFSLPGATISSLTHLRGTASDLARRAGVQALDEVNLDHTGVVLARAFPDRLAVRRGSPGRFQLRTSTTAFMAPSDPLATEDFVVAADLDGHRKDARIRLAAGIDRDHVIASFAHEVDESRRLEWEGERLVDRTTQRLGGIVLASVDRRPQPSDETTTALVRRVRDEGVKVLPWTDKAERLRSRVRHLRAGMGEEWPDWSDTALRATADAWLGPHLSGATSWPEVQALDLARILRSALDPRLADVLTRLAPEEITLPSGRRLEVDYTGDQPRVSVRVQEMYGVKDTPMIAGRPVVLELLSPAGRPIQITSDLAGFWRGSWHQVRKEMAGRYPKHVWPEEPWTLPEGPSS